MEALRSQAVAVELELAGLVDGADHQFGDALRSRARFEHIGARIARAQREGRLADLHGAVLYGVSCDEGRELRIRRRWRNPGGEHAQARKARDAHAHVASSPSSCEAS